MTWDMSYPTIICNRNSLQQRREKQGAEQCFETGKKLMNPKKIDANVSVSYVSGCNAYYQADYELAEQHLQDGLRELKRMDEEQEVDYYHALIEFYTLLAKVYEKQELYNKALEAARNSLKYETRLFDKNSNKTNPEITDTI